MNKWQAISVVSADIVVSRKFIPVVGPGGQPLLYLPPEIHRCSAARMLMVRVGFLGRTGEVVLGLYHRIDHHCWVLAFWIIYCMKEAKFSGP